MKINNKFNEKEKLLLKELNIDIDKDYNKEDLELIEDIVYNKMMDNLDEKQDFTPIAEEFENILNIIVKIVD